MPVELDASRRALATLFGRYLSDDELDGARKVLNAAALTYVAAFVTSLLTLLYWAHVLGLFGGRRDQESARVSSLARRSLISNFWITS